MQHRTMLFSLAVLLLFPLSAQAQARAASRSPHVAPDSAAALAPVGPRVELARAGFSIPSTDSLRATHDAIVAAPVVQRSRETGRTMMLVGGALFLGGLLIGDDVGTAIAVGGLVVGVYGFYQLIR